MPLDARLDALATAVGLPETLRVALEPGDIAEARRLELLMGGGIAHERGEKLLEALRSAEGNENLPDLPGDKVCALMSPIAFFSLLTNRFITGQSLLTNRFITGRSRQASRRVREGAGARKQEFGFKLGVCVCVCPQGVC